MRCFVPMHAGLRRPVSARLWRSPMALEAAPEGAAVRAGMGFNCGQQDTPCDDGPWKKAYCSEGNVCKREYAQLWTCQSGGSTPDTATGGRRLLKQR